MAAIRETKTNLVILIVLCVIIRYTSANDEIHDDVKLAESALLRGSGEERIEDDDDINMPNSDIVEPERSFLEYNSPTDEHSLVEGGGGSITEATITASNIDDKNVNASEDTDAGQTSTASVAMDLTTDTTLPTTQSFHITVSEATEMMGDLTMNTNLSFISPPPTMEDAAETPIPGIKEELEADSHASRIASTDAVPSGQRSPKTDDSEKKQTSEKRYQDDGGPRPTMQIKKSTMLKSWLEDQWLRPPAGILVPLRPMALNRALAVWNDLTATGGLNLTDIVVVAYNSNGVIWRSRHNLQSTTRSGGAKAVTQALARLLQKSQRISANDEADGTLKALTLSSRLVPYDSALFVITDRGAGDAQELPGALRALIEKRLKVYVIWTKPQGSATESDVELQDLTNVTRQTEGDVLSYTLQVMDLDGSPKSEGLLAWHASDYKPSSRRAKTYADKDNYDTLQVTRGGGDAAYLGIPVENGVSALWIHIEGAVEHAVLYPPNDAPLIDLCNRTSVLKFSPNSRTVGESPRDVFLSFPGADVNGNILTVLPMSSTTSESPAPTVGIWHLSVRCDNCDYRLNVAARSGIHFDTKAERDTLRIRVSGPVGSVRESALVDEYGNELAKLLFSYEPTSGEGDKVARAESGEDLIADVPLPSVSGSKIYAKIVGRDTRGSSFVRLSGPIVQREVRSAYIAFPETIDDLERVEEENSRAFSFVHNGNNDTNASPFGRVSQVIGQDGSLLTTVQIGLSTKIYGTPGDTLQLHYEVTNYRNTSPRLYFGASDELSFLTGISPANQIVQPGQTAYVIVNARISTGAQVGARDEVKFTVFMSGAEVVSIRTFIYVVGDTFIPTQTAPQVTHNFQGSCQGRMGSDCAQYSWSASIIARDADEGLLRLSSSPIGLMYDSGFVAGTRDEVTAVYRATCCATRVLVTAVDAFGNTNSYLVDISYYFTPAAIAAIALGVFLAIALILLIIFLIVWCVRKRKESNDLPYASASRSRSLG